MDDELLDEVLTFHLDIKMHVCKYFTGISIDYSRYFVSELSPYHGKTLVIECMILYP